MHSGIVGTKLSGIILVGSSCESLGVSCDLRRRSFGRGATEPYCLRALAPWSLDTLEPYFRCPGTLEPDCLTAPGASVPWCLTDYAPLHGLLNGLLN